MGRLRTHPVWKMPSSEFKELVEKSRSYKEIAAYFGEESVGNAYRRLKTRITEEGICYSHLQNKFDVMVDMNRNSKMPLNEILVRDSSYNRFHLKKRLIDKGILKNECSDCGLGPEWKGKPLVMVLDHINGVNDDNRQENLRLLCPNCNSQTETFSGRNASKKERKCGDCGSPIKGYSEVCRPCSYLRRRTAKRPSKDVILKEVAELGYAGTGRKYGVTGAAVKKWLK